jgi:hypothetical protein
MKPHFPHAVASVSYLLLIRFFIGLLFDHEDGGKVLLRNTGLFATYVALQTKDGTLYRTFSL